ncbi:hypothetical protein MBLNU230_g6397t1 [Neophaeotheca triangularis]
MPSIRNLMQASVPWTASISGFPDSVTTANTLGEPLIGIFSGYVSSLAVKDWDCEEPHGLSAVVPLTVLPHAYGTVTCAGMKEQVNDFLAFDDVFEPSFLKTIYLPGELDLEPGLGRCLEDAYDTQLLLSDLKLDGATHIWTNTSVPVGPYFAHVTSTTFTLGPVYQVQYDENMAFMNGLLPDGAGGGFKYATVNTLSDSTLGIPVPSRLYSRGTEDSADKPLAGVRVTVKDIIDLQGVKTSNDLGATIIGKTKTAQFANADRVTADWVDYHGAFNPRGDGYQDPGVSSTGAGAGTAAYNWVDVSIGSDTGGSIRIPAGKNGVYGIRPSFGAVSNEGVMLEGEYFDALGYHTRSLRMLRDFGYEWFANNPNLTQGSTKLPSKIIIPTNLWPVANNASQAIFDEWITKLAGFLNATVERNSIDTYWNATAHTDYPDTDFWTHMRTVGFDLIWRNQIDKVIEPFRAAYAAAFGGRSPFINPFPAARYASAVNTTQEDVDVAYEKFTYFRDWFGNNVVKADEEACSESLFVIPMATGEPEYRNTIYSPPNVSSWTSFTPYYFSVQSQGPEVTLPIGEISFRSDISNVEEKLPVAIDVLAHRNCDLMLLDLVKALGDAGVLREVNTGMTLW